MLQRRQPQVMRRFVERTDLRRLFPYLPDLAAVSIAELAAVLPVSVESAQASSHVVSVLDPTVARVVQYNSPDSNATKWIQLSGPIISPTFMYDVLCQF